MKMKQAVIENILFNKKKEELKKNEVNVFKKNWSTPFCENTLLYKRL